MFFWEYKPHICWLFNPRPSRTRFRSWTYILTSLDQMRFWHMIWRPDLPATTASQSRSNWDTNENLRVHSLFTACINTYQNTHRTVEYVKKTYNNDIPLQGTSSIHWFQVRWMKRTVDRCTAPTHTLDVRPNTVLDLGSAPRKPYVANPVWLEQCPSAWRHKWCNAGIMYLHQHKNQ